MTEQNLICNLPVLPFSSGGEIYSVLPKMIGEVEAIGKTKRNTTQNYNFRSIDDIYSAINKLLAKYGVTIVPNVIRVDHDRFEGTNGKNVFQTHLVIQYLVFAKDASYVTATFSGEALDTSDKATPKALSMAYKYFIFQLLAVPIDEKLDTEYEHIETKVNHEKRDAYLKRFEEVSKEKNIEKAETDISNISAEIIQDSTLTTGDKEMLRKKYVEVHKEIQTVKNKSNTAKSSQK